MQPFPLVALAAVWLCVATPAGQSAQPRPSPARGLTELSQSLQDLAERVSPSVVQVFVTGYAEPDEDDQAASEPVLERSSGSGVIVDPDGYIITNAHVVERATRVEVELSLAATGSAPGSSVLRRRGRVVGAQIVAIDHETDVAVIKVEGKGLPVLPFGDSETLRPGQIVLAFGSPLGLESSVTLGVVSAVARQLTPEDPMIYIQTDAPINPGNSGGALVDTEGRLVGISTLIYSQSGGNEGIGFAAPSNIVRNVFAQIRKTGRVRRGDIGVHTQTITPLLAEALGVSSDAGVVLSDVDAWRPGGSRRAAARRPGARARRQADGERPSAADQSLRARHQRHGGPRCPARRSQVEPEGAGRRARQRRRTTAEISSRNRCQSERWACSGSTSRPRSPSSCPICAVRQAWSSPASRSWCRTRSRAGCSPATSSIRSTAR